MLEEDGEKESEGGGTTGGGSVRGRGWAAKACAVDVFGRVSAVVQGMTTTSRSGDWYGSIERSAARVASEDVAAGG